MIFFLGGAVNLDCSKNSAYLNLWSFKAKRYFSKETYKTDRGKQGFSVWKRKVLLDTKFLLHLMSSAAGKYHLHSFFSPWKIVSMYSAVHFESPLEILGDNYFGDIIFCSPTDGPFLQNAVLFSCRNYWALHVFYHSTRKVEKQQVRSISKSNKLGIGANGIVDTNFLYLSTLISHFAKRDSQCYLKLEAAMRCRYGSSITEHILKIRVICLLFLWPLANV